jgi:hypothetical protein
MICLSRKRKVNSTCLPIERHVQVTDASPSPTEPIENPFFIRFLKQIPMAFLVSFRTVQSTCQGGGITAVSLMKMENVVHGTKVKLMQQSS